MANNTNIHITTPAGRSITLAHEIVRTLEAAGDPGEIVDQDLDRGWQLLRRQPITDLEAVRASLLADCLDGADDEAIWTEYVDEIVARLNGPDDRAPAPWVVNADVAS